MSTRETTVAIFVCLFVGTSASWGVPVVYSANGHYYDIVLHFTDASWVEMMLEATTLDYLGVAGHLATITSQEENDFIADNVVTQRQYGCYFIGGYKSGSDWYWITGEPWSYTNWKPGEPTPGEIYLSYIAYPPPDAYGQWNNVNTMWEPNAPHTAHYIVEYPVPEPGTMSLLALAGLAVCRRRARV